MTQIQILSLGADRHRLISTPDAEDDPPVEPDDEGKWWWELGVAPDAPLFRIQEAYQTLRNVRLVSARHPNWDSVERLEHAYRDALIAHNLTAAQLSRWPRS